MKIKTVFTEPEVEILQQFLEIYKASGFSVLNKELNDSLVNSSLTKLKNLTSLTFFTKQEYTVMYMALDYAKSNQDRLGIVLHGKVHQLISKLCTLAL